MKFLSGFFNGIVATQDDLDQHGITINKQGKITVSGDIVGGNRITNNQIPDIQEKVKREISNKVTTQDSGNTLSNRINIGDNNNLKTSGNCGNCGAGFSVISLENGACTYCGSATIDTTTEKLTIEKGLKINGNHNKYNNTVFVDCVISGNHNRYEKTVLINCTIKGNHNNIYGMIGGNVDGNHNKVNFGGNISRDGNHNEVRNQIGSIEQILKTL